MINAVYNTPQSELSYSIEGDQSAGLITALAGLVLLCILPITAWNNLSAWAEFAWLALSEKPHQSTLTLNHIMIQTLINLIPATLGLTLCSIATTVYGYKKTWVLTAMKAASLLLFILPPIGPIVGTMMLKTLHRSH